MSYTVLDIVETYHVVKEVIIQKSCDMVELVFIMQHNFEKEALSSQTMNMQKCTVYWLCTRNCVKHWHQ
jgi:hypothetical protein